MARKPKASASAEPTDNAGVEAPAAQARGRGRPKGAKNKARELTNENPDEVAKCFSEYVSLMRDQARIAQRIATLFDRYEKTGGVDRKAIKIAYKMSQQDPEIVARERAREDEYMRLLGIIEVDDDGQVVMSEDFAPTVPKKLTNEAQELIDRARAYSDGYNTGLAGGTLEHNTHEPGSMKHQEWVVGFHDGDAERLLANPDAGKVTVASTRRTKKQPTKPANDEQTDLEDFTKREPAAAE